MAIYILRHGVNHNICSMIQGILHIGTKKCVVNNNHDTMSMCYRGNISNVNQTECRVTRTLYPDQFGLIGPNKLCHIDLDAWRKGDLNAMGSSNLGKVAMCTAIDI